MSGQTKLQEKWWIDFLYNSLLSSDPETFFFVFSTTQGNVTSAEPVDL